MITPRRASAATALPVLSLLVAFLLGACASPGDSSRGSSTGPVTQEQIVEVSASDVYEVLQRLRPRWLRSRGPVSIQYPDAGFPVVYVDEMRFGPLETLRQIDVNSVRLIEFINAGDATTRFGIGHTGGIIMVSTRP